MVDREQAIRVIRSSRFGHLEPELVELLEPSIRVGVKPTELEDLPLGASRFGGPADLPESLAWPRYGVRPLALVAQLRLSDLAPHDARQLLPPQGWLYFFFDAANETPYADQDEQSRSWRVLYYDGSVEDLKRTEPPEPRDEKNEFGCCAAAFSSEFTLPSFGSTLLAGIPLKDDQRLDYERLVFSLPGKPPLPESEPASGLRRWLGRMKYWWMGDPIHRVLGHPEHFNLDPRVDWQRLAQHRSVVTTPDNPTKDAARQWLLLLQVDTYQDGPDWLWGDNGTFYFGIHKDDLAARNFDAVQWTIECG